jgi:hypothetical protein
MVNVSALLLFATTSMLVFLTTITISAQQIPGGLPEAYLLRDVAARAIGLGGAYSAVANEPTAIFYNPAGLSFLPERPQVYGMYTVLDFGRQHNFLGFGQNIYDDFGVGVAVNNYVAGSFTGRLADGTPLKEYTNQQLAAQVAGSYRYKFISVGIGGKYLLNTLQGADISSNGWVIDAGIKLNLVDLLSVGLSVQNLAGQMTANNNASTKYTVPYTIRFGVASEFGFNADRFTSRRTTLGERQVVEKQASSYLLASVEAAFTQGDVYPVYMVGLEFSPIREFAIRGGTNIHSDDKDKGRFFNFRKYALGVSLRPNIKELPFYFSIDYTAAHDALIQDTFSHHVSFLLEF